MLNASKCLFRAAHKNLTLVLNQVKAPDLFIFLIIFYRQRLHIPVVRDRAKLVLASSKVKAETFGASNRPSSVFTLRNEAGTKISRSSKHRAKPRTPNLDVSLFKLRPRPPRTNRTNDAAMFPLQAAVLRRS